MPSMRCLYFPHYWEDSTQIMQSEGGRMEEPLLEILAWLFVKTDDEIVSEAEVAALHSMLLAEDPRPERAGA